MPVLPFPYRLISLCMAFIILSSTIGISIDRHYCKGELKNTSFWGIAKSCYELSEYTSCKHETANTYASLDLTQSCHNNCCENQSISLQIDSNLIITAVFTTSFKQASVSYCYLLSKLVKTPFICFARLFTSLSKSTVFLLNKPLLCLIQCYLL